MIVPRNRLLWCVALLGVFSLLVVRLEEGALLSVAGVLLLAVVAAADLVRGRAKGEPLRVAAPGIVRLIRNRDETIPLYLKTLHRRVGSVRIALVLPPDIASKHDEIRVRPAEAEGDYEIAWECRPVRTGKYPFSRVYWQVDSPFGLWGMGGSAKCKTELRVYPDLSKERKTVAAYFLNRGMSGLHAYRMVGRGREFERLREYVAGDSYDEIHWKATARRGEPITKVFQVERTQEVYVAIDASRLSARMPSGPEGAIAHGGGIPDTILDRFVTASLVLGMAAEKQGDHFGLLAFGKQVKRFLRAGSGKAHYSACRDALYTLQPEEGAPDLGEVFSFLSLRLRKRALVVFLTSLEDPLMEENFTRQIGLLARKHLVMVNMIKPAGVERLFSERDAPGSKDELYARLAGHMRWHDVRETGIKLQHQGVHFSLLENERLTPELVSQYMMVKQRQLV